MKARILNVLRRESGLCSGEALSRELGVSRVTIWKHLQALQDLGYVVEAGSRGYRLLAAPDALYPWEFPGREDRIHYYPGIDSTMNAARELARRGCPHFTAVVADRQTGGRGRMDRSWHSEIGGLYVTLVLRPNLPVVESHKVCFAAGLELVHTIRETVGVAATVKWPNDLLVGERKLAGMLSEMEASGDLVTFVNIGIGLNVNNDPTDREPSSVCLKSLLGRTVSRRELLSDFLDRFEKRVADSNLEGVVSEWKSFTNTLGRDVCIRTLSGTLNGRAEEVDDDGALRVRGADGRLHRVLFGDCFHKGDAPV